MAVSRAQSHGVGLLVKTDLRFPSGPNGEAMPSYQVAVGCDVHGTEEQRRAALVDLEKFQTPASTRQIEEWLAELSVISASRGRGEFEAELMVSAYASRLAKYPADIVRHALLTHAWKWWPAWDELQRVCETKAGPRRQMIEALKQPPPNPEVKTRPATQEERDRVQAMVDEMFPQKSAYDRRAAVDEALKGNCMKDESE